MKWQELVKNQLNLSEKSTWITSENASHSIHQDRPDIIIDAIENMKIDLLSISG